MRGGIASREIFTRNSITGQEVVLAQVPSDVHRVLTQVSALSGAYCPTCTPSRDAKGAPEHPGTDMRHEGNCARMRTDL